MTIALQSIWRHPIKGHGAERLDQSELQAGQTLAGDRIWAIAHDAAKPEALTGDWAHCVNYQCGRTIHGIHAITSRLDLAARRLTLSHPDLPDVTVLPDDEQGAASLLRWVLPLVPKEKRQPVAVVRARAAGFTDNDVPSVSLNSRSSLRALSQKVGKPLTEERFRGNLWFDGDAPFGEFDWIGKTARLGGARLQIFEPITRCGATMVDPSTGHRDHDVPASLRDGWGHEDFGVLARTIETGTIRSNDRLEFE